MMKGEWKEKTSKEQKEEEQKAKCNNETGQPGAENHTHTSVTKDKCDSAQYKRAQHRTE